MAGGHRSSNNMMSTEASLKFIPNNPLTIVWWYCVCVCADHNHSHTWLVSEVGHLTEFTHSNLKYAAGASCYMQTCTWSPTNAQLLKADWLKAIGVSARLPLTLSVLRGAEVSTQST